MDDEILVLSQVDSDVVQMAVDVMGSLEAAAIWLTSPAYAFGFSTPLQVLKAPGGKERVVNEIGRIAHGIPS